MRTRWLGFLTCAVAAVICVAGCAELLLGIPLGIGQLQWELRRTAKPCAGRPCDPQQWIRFSAVLDPFAETSVHAHMIRAFVPGLPCLPLLELPFLEPLDLETGSGERVSDLAVRRDDLTLGLLTRRGRVYVAPFAAVEATASADLEAIGVGWANQSRRLAVVSPADGLSGKQDRFVLRIMDDRLAGLDERTLSLPETVDISNSAPLVVSWSADDLWIAISTRSWGQPGMRVAPACTILAVEDGRSVEAALSDVHFVGPDEIVAVEPSSGPAGEGSRVAVYRLSGDVLVRLSVVPGALSVVAADAPSGVFLTGEPPPPFITPPPMVGMRMVGVGPQLASFPGTGETLAIAPLNEDTRPVLLAAGLDPNDVVADPQTLDCVQDANASAEAPAPGEGG